MFFFADAQLVYWPFISQIVKVFTLQNNLQCGCCIGCNIERLLAHLFFACKLTLVIIMFVTIVPPYCVIQQPNLVHMYVYNIATNLSAQKVNNNEQQNLWFVFVTLVYINPITTKLCTQQNCQCQVL